MSNFEQLSQKLEEVLKDLVQEMEPRKIPQERRWTHFPEILFEVPTTPGEKGNPLPYIETEEQQKLPPMLVIFDYHRTGEKELYNNKEVDVVEQIPHQYMDMQFLQETLPPATYDFIRLSIGLKPLNVAKKEGTPILQKVIGKINMLKDEALRGQKERMDLVQKEIEKSRKAQGK